MHGSMADLDLKDPYDSVDPGLEKDSSEKDMCKNFAIGGNRPPHVCAWG